MSVIRETCVRAYDFCIDTQRRYHQKYHDGDGECGCLYGGDYSASNLGMLFNRWGVIPGVAFVSGLARWAFGTVEMGVGFLGTLAGMVGILVIDFFRLRQDLIDGLNDVAELYNSGVGHFWQGAQEALSFGFYREIQALLFKIEAWRAFMGYLEVWQRDD